MFRNSEFWSKYNLSNLLYFTTFSFFISIITFLNNFFLFQTIELILYKKNIFLTFHSKVNLLNYDY